MRWIAHDDDDVLEPARLHITRGFEQGAVDNNARDLGQHALQPLRVQGFSMRRAEEIQPICGEVEMFFHSVQA